MSHHSLFPHQLKLPITGDYTTVFMAAFKWCQGHMGRLGDSWMVSRTATGNIYYFKNGDDAMLFKLTFL
jgi:hypothetical protein